MQKGAAHNALHIADGRAAVLFGGEGGQQIEPRDDLAELALEAQVAALCADLVGQQQGLALGVAALAEQPGGGFDVARGVVEVLASMPSSKKNSVLPPWAVMIMSAVAWMKAATRSPANSGARASAMAAMSRRPCSGAQGWRCNTAVRSCYNACSRLVAVALRHSAGLRR